jgi:hypothetical protein
MMFWARLRLAASIRGSQGEKTPITGVFGVAFLIPGKQVALSFFAMSLFLIVSVYTFCFAAARQKRPVADIL